MIPIRGAVQAKPGWQRPGSTGPDSVDGPMDRRGISEETVPNATLLRMWNYAVDPRKEHHMY